MYLSYNYMKLRKFDQKIEFLLSLTFYIYSLFCGKVIKVCVWGGGRACDLMNKGQNSFFLLYCLRILFLLFKFSFQFILESHFVRFSLYTNIRTLYIIHQHQNTIHYTSTLEQFTLYFNIRTQWSLLDHSWLSFMQFHSMEYFPTITSRYKDI